MTKIISPKIINGKSILFKKLNQKRLDNDILNFEDNNGDLINAVNSCLLDAATRGEKQCRIYNNDVKFKDFNLNNRLLLGYLRKEKYGAYLSMITTENDIVFCLNIFW